MNKFFAVIMIVAVVIALGLWIIDPNTEPALPDYITTTYTINGATVTLVTDPAAPVGPTNARFFGNGAEGDLNGDGKNDVAFLITRESTNDITYYLVAALSTASGYRSVPAVLLGTNIAPQGSTITDGEIVVNYAERAPGQPTNTQPSVGVSRYFRLSNGTLAERIPVTTRTVQLFYYNEELDMDDTGNIMCSEEGLVPVEREIPITETPLQDSIRELLKGNLTEEEIADGISTEYPLEGLTLVGANLDEEGLLTLAFEDPNNATVGGACRTGILWRQIEATALQFPDVVDVRFMPEDLFQP